MKHLTQIVGRLPEYKSLVSAIKNGKGIISLYGIGHIHKAHFAASIGLELNRPMCIISRDEQTSRKMQQDLTVLLQENVAFLPCRDFIFHNIDNVSREHEQARICALNSILSGESRILCASTDGMMLRTMPPDIMANCAIALELGGEYSLTDLADRFVAAGYSRTITVEGPGQFALRGGILDIFPAGSDAPVRAEFFGDEIDSLGVFDTMTQRRRDNLKQVFILPTRETLPQHFPGGGIKLASVLKKAALQAKGQLKLSLEQDALRLEQEGLFAACDRYMPKIYDKIASAFSYLPSDTIIVIDDTAATSECARGLVHRQSEDISHLLENGIISGSKSGWNISFEDMRVALSDHQTLLFDNFLSQSAFSPQEIFSISAKQLPSYGGNLETAISDIESYLSNGYTVYALSGGKQRAHNLNELLSARGISCVMDEEQAGIGRICILAGNLSAGFEYPSISVAVIAEGQLLAQKGKPTKKSSNKDKLKSFTDLSPGDLVVHDHHGIGRFIGVERIKVDNVYRDYIKLAFSGTDFVFVPATALDLVSKYIGAGENTTVKLSKLGGTAWVKAKTRAKKAAVDMADSLIKLYSMRKNTEGFAFSEDDDMQMSFEEAFPYDETDDQLTSAREIKQDMQKSYPMDRLLCGDVGFGKTEVAFRAIMKCVLSGKQAAVLVPTTVLARQHFLTACQRFSGYPLKIAMLSRYRTAAQMRETISQCRTGKCDIVVGTHRILQKDVKFKNLGLLVVDEEQRFGVTHKEQIKQMSHAVDVLTLSATPIPRTLNMALSGIRDMSVLEEPPVGRQPVQTYVLEHDIAIVRDAIRRELARGGQIYYLHNRIESIEDCAGRLQRAFPDTVIATAHGKMGEESMSDVMSRMYAGDISILVCTTIIETGVDIPNVNTLIIEDADHMGLAQLHQIRGRVGRSMRHAYAYLTYRKGKVLTEISQKRLSAIREFAEFGSGFKIAMRDLEIRGAGNILGAEQSGHMESVGYDMYLKLLDEATGDLLGEKRTAKTDCTADILINAGLPQGYIADAATRVDLYRRIAMIRSNEDYIDMQDEMTDRFGDIPAAGMALLDIALLRSKASACFIREINHRGNSINFVLAQTDIEKISALCADPNYKGRILLNASDKPYFSLRLRPNDDVLKIATQLIDFYATLNTEGS